MHKRWARLGLMAACAASLAVIGLTAIGGCTAGAASVLYSPLFTTFIGSDNTVADTTGDSSFFNSGSRVNVDPCSSQTPASSYASMRNLASGDYVHYFLVLVAFVNGDTYPTGAVCPDDVDLILPSDTPKSRKVTR